MSIDRFSETIELDENSRDWLRPGLLPRSRNNETMEYWFLKENYPFFILSSIPILLLTDHFSVPKRLVSLFHYSNIPNGVMPLIS